MEFTSVNWKIYPEGNKVLCNIDLSLRETMNAILSTYNLTNIQKLIERYDDISWNKNTGEIELYEDISRHGSSQNILKNKLQLTDKENKINILVELLLKELEEKENEIMSTIKDEIIEQFESILHEAQSMWLSEYCYSAEEENQRIADDKETLQYFKRLLEEFENECKNR